MKFPAQLSVTLLQQFDRVALGSLLPVAMVSFYAVPLRISQRLGQVAENVAGPFYPAVTSHLAAERIETLRRQYRQGTRMVMGAVCGAIAVLGGLAGPLLGVWMGVDFASHGTWPFRLLLLAYGASALFTLPSVAADAAGRPGIPAAFMVVGSLVHVAFIWLAVPHFGLSGAAGGVLLGFLLPLLSGVPTMHLRIAALPPLRSLFSEVRSAVLAGAISGLAAWAMSHAAYPSSGPLALIISLAVCSLLYLGLVFLLGGLRVEELRRAVLLLRSVPKVNTD